MSGESARIDHQTIDYLFDRLEPINGDAVHYYRAIRGLGEQEIERTERFEGLGRIGAYIVFKDGAPRRVAHINRNGMLITDSREQKSNPLAPKGRSLWPDFVGVVVPETDAGDLWLRRMENPSHDSLSSGQLLKESDRREAERRLKRARRALGELIERKAGIDKYGEASNLDELAGVLPDVDDVTGTRTLATRVIESQAPKFDISGLDADPQGKDGGSGDSDGDGGVDHGDEGRRGLGNDRTAPATRSDRGAILQRVRYIPLSATEAIIAFNPVSDPPREVRLSLTAAGADRDPQHVKPVAIIEATRMGDGGMPLDVSDGEIAFTPDSSDRVTIKIVADGNLDRNAFRLR